MIDIWKETQNDRMLEQNGGQIDRMKDSNKDTNKDRVMDRQDENN